MSDNEVVLIEEKGHTSYCDNCLKDGVTYSKLAFFAFSTDRTVEIVTKKVSWTNLIPWRKTVHYHLNPGRGVLGSSFAGYVPLVSQNPYSIIVYSLANYKPLILVTL